MESTSSVREELARRSEEWNVDNDAMFNTLWPDYKEQVTLRRKQAREEQRNTHKPTTTTTTADNTATATNTTSTAQDASKQDTKQEQRNEAGGGGGGGGGGGNPRGGVGRLPLGFDKLMATIAVASVAFGVVVLYTYH